MNNKNTCGECKWFVLNSEGRCRSNEGEENANNDCCSFFEPKVITNGDIIRQMSNEELAKLIVPKVMFCDGCPVRCAEKDIPQSKINPFGADVIEDVCAKRVEAWLKAPAVCVKQNENDDAQTDLCTACNTESEGKDE